MSFIIFLAVAGNVSYPAKADIRVIKRKRIISTLFGGDIDGVTMVLPSNNLIFITTIVSSLAGIIN